MFGVTFSAILIGLGVTNLDNHGVFAIIIGILIFAQEYVATKKFDEED